MHMGFLCCFMQYVQFLSLILQFRSSFKNVINIQFSLSSSFRCFCVMNERADLTCEGSKSSFIGFRILTLLGDD